MEGLELPPRPWIVGHRGAAGEEVENTLESVLLAIDQGADMVEIDVQLTADQELVVFHDWTLERLAGRTETVEEVAFRELSRIQLLGSRRRKRRIPTLDDILTATPETVALNLELKRRSADPQRLAARLLATIRDRRRLLVSSFDWDLLAVLRSLAPSLAIAPLAKENRTALVRAGDRLGASSLHAHRRLATAFLMRLARPAGRPVLAYTVNDAGEARELLRRGVAGFFTDFPGRLRRRLGLDSAPRALDETPR